ncbi:ECF transporter S component [Diplocloster agilis]|uniref:ECF transporter S component n=1 Tax=Diplocloster agilis TaxID=2850323 RepID=UPI000822B583|nr:ECF transporter S component [Suonthocola fibrivorans]MCU6733861.1 ECF transporter S component [Suonthocola fibrivorans]SCJ13019.1 Putative HMP/thiamine permease protein ykoE [uncultured Clostridium sp.]
MSKFKWKLHEVIFVAMLCIVFGVVYLAGVYLASFLSTVLTPFGLAPLANEIVFGVWFMASTLAAYILQKPGVAIVSEVLAALIEVLMGNMYGPMVIVAGIIQGAGGEIVFAGWKYKRFDALTMNLAAAGCCITSFLWSFVRSGYGLLSVKLLIVMFLIRLVSSVLFAGVLCKLMGDGLAKTGLLKSYALGRANA